MVARLLRSICLTIDTNMLLDMEVPDQQILAAREVLLSGSNESKDGVYPNVRRKLIQLLVNSGYLGEASIAYYEAKRAMSDEDRSSLISDYGPSINEIDEIIDSDKAFERKITLNDDGYAFFMLVKPTFAANQVVGNIDAVKLRCDRKFKKLDFQASHDYQVPKGLGLLSGSIYRAARVQRNDCAAWKLIRSTCTCRRVKN